MNDASPASRSTSGWRHSTSWRRCPYRTTGEGLASLSEPATVAMEITEPTAAKLYLSSDTQDADLFLVFGLPYA